MTKITAHFDFAIPQAHYLGAVASTLYDLDSAQECEFFGILWKIDTVFFKCRLKTGDDYTYLIRHFYEHMTFEQICEDIKEVLEGEQNPLDVHYLQFIPNESTDGLSLLLNCMGKRLIDYKGLYR